jgi:hypothetical protein
MVSLSLRARVTWLLVAWSPFHLVAKTLGALDTQWLGCLVAWDTCSLVAWLCSHLVAWSAGRLVFSSPSRKVAKPPGRQWRVLGRAEMDWMTLSDLKRVPYRNYTRVDNLGGIFFGFLESLGPKTMKKSCFFFEKFDLIYYVSIRCHFWSDKVPLPYWTDKVPSFYRR